MRLFGLTAAALLALLGAVPALSHGGDPYGEPGDPKAPSRTVTVAMVEKDDGHMAYLPNAIEVKIGEQFVSSCRTAVSSTMSSCWGRKARSTSTPS